MARLVSICALLAMLAAPAHATPKWLRITGRVIVYTAPVATSLWATHEGHLCRQRVDVAHCDGGYGSFAGREVARGGISLTFTGLSWWGHREGYKEWFAPAVGIAAYNGITAIQQSRVTKHKGEL